MEAAPVAITFPIISSDFAPINTIRNAINANKRMTIAVPTKPNSSPIAVKIKSLSMTGT